MKTPALRRGSLIHYSLDGIKRESFDVIAQELKGVLERRAGVYALYQNDKTCSRWAGKEHLLEAQKPCKSKETKLEYRKPFHHWGKES
jgi:hypothetical protein